MIETNWYIFYQTSKCWLLNIMPFENGQVEGIVWPVSVESVISRKEEGFPAADAASQR